MREEKILYVKGSRVDFDLLLESDSGREGVSCGGCGAASGELRFFRGRQLGFSGMIRQEGKKGENEVGVGCSKERGRR